MVSWSQLTLFRPLAQPSGYGLRPPLYCKQQQALNFELMGIAGDDPIKLGSFGHMCDAWRTLAHGGGHMQ